MSSPDTFGIALRRARQHRGVSLSDIAARTNVKVDLWEEMERNDFSRWPTGVYARTWIRAYAEMVGLDPHKTVDDFCRWFPQGDRRTEATLRRHAEIIGHTLTWQDDLAPAADRRAAPTVAPHRSRGLQTRHVRLVAAAADLGAVMVLVMIATAVLPIDRWPALGVVATLYYVCSLASAGCTPAASAMDAYAHRDPGFYRRGDALPFRRVSSNDMHSNIANAER